MSRHPYANFPFPYYRRFSRTQSSSYNIPQSYINNSSYNRSNYIANSSIEFDKSNSHQHNNAISDFSANENCRNLKQKNKSNKNTDYLFDLFGLKIFSDDVLLVSLIYFLYSEGVKDDGLFIVLILLLLS